MNQKKKIRVKHLLKSQDLKSIKFLQKDCFSDEYLYNIEDFKHVLSTNYLELCCLDQASQMYVCGYAVHSVMKKIKCNICETLILDGKGQDIGDDYFDYLQRGGLCIPTQSVQFICFHLCALFETIINDPSTKSQLFQKHDVTNILCHLTFLSLDSGGFHIELDEDCLCGQPNRKTFQLICRVLVNILLNNFSKHVNDLNNIKSNKRKLNVYLKSN